MITPYSSLKSSALGSQTDRSQLRTPPPWCMWKNAKILDIRKWKWGFCRAVRNWRSSSQGRSVTALSTARGHRPVHCLDHRSAHRQAPRHRPRHRPGSGDAAPGSAAARRECREFGGAPCDHISSPITSGVEWAVICDNGAFPGGSGRSAARAGRRPEL